MSEKMGHEDIFGPPYQPPVEPGREEKLYIDLHGQHQHYEKRFAPEPFQIETNENGHPMKYPDLPDDEFVVADVTTAYGEHHMFLCYNLRDLRIIFGSYQADRTRTTLRSEGAATIVWQHLLPEDSKER